MKLAIITRADGLIVGYQFQDELGNTLTSLPMDATLVVSDIQIGAVEGKDGTTDARWKVGALSSFVIGDNGLGVADPVLQAALIAILGTTADVAVLDASGTLNAHVRGAVQELVALLATAGASADVVVAAGAAGSLSAKLRRATQGLEDLKSLIVLAAGAAIIGKVGIDQTTPGTTNGVVETPRTITANQSIAYTGTHGASAVVNALTTEVIVTLTTDGYIAIGGTPTATTGDMFLPAYVPSPPLKVTGNTSKVSAIRDALSGTMKIAEFSR